MSDEPKKQPEVDPNKSLRSQFPANNGAAKEKVTQPKKDITPLAGIVAQKQKPPMMRRIRDAFTGDDSSSFGEYLILQILVPAVKTTLYDLITGGANRALFGQGVRPGQQSIGSGGRINYGNLSRLGTSDVGQQRALSQFDMATHQFNNIILNSRADADQVLSALVDILQKYDMVTVSDLYELVNVTGSYVDDKWGWYNLAGATISPVRGGFVLNLPPTEQLR